MTFTRLFDKPFTVSEYNYSGPGRYRGVGGILTGSMGAIQGWGVLWRFAYAHSRDDIVRPGRLDYFNMATDPLSQAAERASICLFLREDMRPAPHSVTVAMTTRDLTEPPQRIPSLAPSWHWAAWVTRVGTSLVQDPATPLPQDVVLPLGWVTPASAYSPAKVVDAGDPYQISSDKLVELLRSQGILTQSNPTDPAKNVFQCETGEITIDAPQDVMTLDTPRTAGGFAPSGVTIRTKHGVEVEVQDTDATVWVSALDDQPITQSSRLLVTHLTDLQNTGIRYAERCAADAVGVGPVAALGASRQGRDSSASDRSGRLPSLGAGNQRKTTGGSPLASIGRRSDLHRQCCRVWRPRSHPLLRNRSPLKKAVPLCAKAIVT